MTQPVTLDAVIQYIDDHSYGGAPLQASDHEHDLMALIRAAQLCVDELQNIVNADLKDFDNNFGEFHDWVRNRARHTLAAFHKQESGQ